SSARTPRPRAAGSVAGWRSRSSCSASEQPRDRAPAGPRPAGSPAADALGTPPRRDHRGLHLPLGSLHVRSSRSPSVTGMESFAGKVAVVTGAASGIGRALADRFAREGMRVVLADVDREALDEATEALADEFGADNVAGVFTDVRDEVAVQGLADTTFERFGTAHIVCNNAGIGTGGLAW